MTEEISIQSLDNRFSHQAIDVILPIQTVEFGVAVTLEQQPDLLDIESFYLAPGGGFWGAFHQGKLIGTIALVSIGHQAGAIRKMFVRKEYRGKELSVAQRLLDTLLVYCKDHGITDLYLGTVDAFRAAHRFYERNGFHRIVQGDLPDYFPRMIPDTIFYHLPLVSSSAARQINLSPGTQNDLV